MTGVRVIIPGATHMPYLGKIHSTTRATRNQAAKKNEEVGYELAQLMKETMDTVSKGPLARG